MPKIIKKTLKFQKGSQYCYLHLDYENKKFTISKDKDSLGINYIFKDTNNDTTDLLTAMKEAMEFAFRELKMKQ